MDSIEHLVSLKEYVEKLVDSLDKRVDQRFLDSDKAISTTLTAQEKAVTKAEAASEKRFEGVNEFRNTLSDQQRTLMPRSEAELRFSTNEKSIAEMKDLVTRLTGERKGTLDTRTLVLGLLTLILGVIAYLKP